MYNQKKKIVIVPKCIDGRLTIDKVLQNDFGCPLQIVGNGEPGDPGYYNLQSVCGSPIFAGYEIAQTTGFCNIMNNGHVYIIRKDPDPTESKAAIIIFDDPNGNPVDGSFGEY